MIRHKLELALEEEGHIIAEVQVYDLPRTLIKRRSGVSRRCLIRFYESFGFKRVSLLNDIMVRRVNKFRW